MRTNNIKYTVIDNDNAVFECTGDYGSMTVVKEDPLMDDISKVFTLCDATVEELIAAQPKPVLQSTIMITWYDENTIIVLDTLGKRYNVDANGTFRVGKWLIIIGNIDEKMISVLVHNLNGPIELSRYAPAPKGTPVIINIYLQGDQEIVDLHIAESESNTTDNTSADAEKDQQVEPENTNIEVESIEEPITDAEVIDDSKQATDE